MKEILKILLSIIKERKEEKKYRATLANMPLCYEALEYMLKKVDTTNVVIEIQQTDREGNHSNLILRKEKPEQFKSFRDKFNERNS